MTQENELTREQAITQVAMELEGPVSFEAFTERVLSIWPSKAKNPQAGVRQDIRNYHQGKTVIFLDKDTLVPMQVGLAGVRFRVPLARAEIDQGLFYVYPALQFILPEGFPVADIQLVDEADHAIPAEVVTRKVKADSLLGPYTYEVTALNLGWWYRKNRLKRHSSLLVMILDLNTGKFRLQPESVQERRRLQPEIDASNRQLADTFFAMLEEDRRESLLGREAIPTAYACLKDAMTYPADHWLDVIENDPRMQWSGYEIRYCEECIDHEHDDHHLEEIVY